MANQMTPDELRAAAEKLTTPFHGDDRVVSAPDDREWWNALKAARDATRRLADVIEYAERERERLLRIPAASMYAQGQYDLHDIILRIARGDTTNHENRSENDG